MKTKKLLVTLLAATLSTILLFGCGTSSDSATTPSRDSDETEPLSTAGMVSETENSQPVIYPLTIDSTLLDSAVGVPATIFSTPAEENGLTGTAYYMTGTVSSIVSSDDSLIGYSYFIVENDNGEAMFFDFADYVAGVSADSGADSSTIQKLQDIYSYGYDATFPEAGENVIVYGLYVGYSDVMNAPVFYYGLNENQQESLFNDKDDEGSESNAEESSSESTEEVITTGQRNALKQAKNYLKIMSFSYSGLVEQLEYEGYSTEEAVYAVDNCGTDWNEQAALKAQEYLDVMSFSRSGLIDQLMYDGFSSEQAEYGVTAAGY